MSSKKIRLSRLKPPIANGDDLSYYTIKIKSSAHTKYYFAFLVKGEPLMKKATAILIALMLILSFAACGGKSNNNSTAPIPEKPADKGATVKTNLWTLNYDPEVWEFDKSSDIIDTDTQSSLSIMIPSESEPFAVNVEIRAFLEDPYFFRDMLVSYNYDQYQYAENNAYETFPIGGVPCLMYQGEYWGDQALHYFGRDESAGATVFVEVIGEYEDPRAAELLSGLEFTLTDVGGKDGPWPWQGKPFSGGTHTAKVGTRTVTAQWLPMMNDALLADSIFGHTAAVLGDKVYILGDNSLKKFDFDGSSLEYTEEIALTGRYEAIQSTNDGTLWLSSPMEPLAAFENDKLRENYEGPSKVSMHPSGEWGVSWFYSPECQIIRPHADTMDISSITFKAVTDISSLTTDENYIFVCGDVTDGTGHKVCVYTSDGTLWYLLGSNNTEGLGIISYVKETENGFIGFDSYTNEVVFWNVDGICIDTVAFNNIFGTNNPWFCHAAPLEDGSLMVLLTDERADRSATELVAFKLSGF